MKATWLTSIISALAIAGITAVISTGRSWDRELLALRQDVTRHASDLAALRREVEGNTHTRPAPETLARLNAAETALAEIKRRLEALEHRRHP